MRLPSASSTVLHAAMAGLLAGTLAACDRAEPPPAPATANELLLWASMAAV